MLKITLEIDDTAEALQSRCRGSIEGVITPPGCMVAVQALLKIALDLQVKMMGKLGRNVAIVEDKVRGGEDESTEAEG